MAAICYGDDRIILNIPLSSLMQGCALVAARRLGISIVTMERGRTSPSTAVHRELLIMAS